MARPTPYALIRQRLEPALGPRVDLLPKRWERLGDVLVLKLPGSQGDRQNWTASEAQDIAATYADILGARVVLRDTEGSHGELRRPTAVRLHGDGPAVTQHTENGIRYHIDPERIMWSSGNIDERVRMAKLDASREHVVDLFAGIGYYTLPLLVHARAAKVTACELNPESAAFLAKNAKANHVADRIDIREGDCRNVAPRAVADRVLMGYFPHCHRFLPTAIACLKPSGGWIHYHDTAKAPPAADDAAPTNVRKPHTEQELLQHLEAALGRQNETQHPSPTTTSPPVEVVAHHYRTVKSYAPGVVHGVLDVELRPQ